MKVLVAEDDPVSRRLLEATLQKWGYDPLVCTNGTQAVRALTGEDVPQLAILDWMMPELDGVHVCREVRRRPGPYVYLLLLTAKSQKEDLIEGMEAGADDYLTKPFDPQELRVRLRAGERILDLQSRLMAACDRLREQATHDPLTGLWNHSAILDILRRELSRSAREKHPLCVLLFDIDHFKRVNDTLGHATGDAVLCEIARRMRECIRDYDAFGRYGGEEFLAVVPGLGAEHGWKVAERFRHLITGTPFDTPAAPVTLTLSVGVATNDGHDEMDQGVLVRSADVALYRAKNAGRNRTEVATDDEVRTQLLLGASERASSPVRPTPDP